MSGINWAGVIKGTVVAFVVYGILHAISTPIILTMLVERVAPVVTPLAVVFWVVGTLTGLFVLMTGYAVARARFGPGPLTAIKVACAFYLFLAIPAIQNRLVRIGPNYTPVELLTMLAVIFGSMVVATLAGAWMYSEPAAQVAPQEGSKSRAAGA